MGDAIRVIFRDLGGADPREEYVFFEDGSAVVVVNTHADASWEAAAS